jgi:dihydroorotate dehydrogenase electron transfer subunit
LRQVTAKVKSNEEVLPATRHRSGRNMSGVHLTCLDCPEIAQEARPGQFVMVSCGEKCVLPRPFSIHQVNKDSIALYFNVWEDGKGTSWLAQRKAGDEVGVIGPLGNGFSILPKARNLLLVAGGIGIASLRFLADEAVKQGLEVTLLCGTPNRHQYPEERLPPEIKLVRVTEDGSTGTKGLATDLLPDFASGADQVFACGPTAMYRGMANMRQLKDKPVQISLEARMGCGRGVCYSCTVRTKKGLKQVCRDGPVFTLDDIIWDELSPKL